MIRKLTFFIVLFITTTSTITAQKQVTLEEIWSGAFRTQGMDELNAMKNTNQYTVLNFNRATRSMKIDLYDYATLNKVATLIDSKDFTALRGIDSYIFNKKENQVLIANNSNQIFRHSFTADYFLYDLASKKLTKIADYEIQEPTFSPDGTKIAYAYQNNLFIYDIAAKKHSQITTDGKKNEIINGIADWVYEEEFSFNKADKLIAYVRAFDWNKTSDKLAFIRFDESQVPEFSMDLYNQGLYPTQQVFKYPKAGEKNSDVSLHIFNLKSNNTKQVDLSKYNDFYLPRLDWTNEANVLSVQVLNRHQNNLDLLFVDGNTADYKVVLNEKDKAYIDLTVSLTFLNDNSFIWTSEKDGFNHIYHYDKNGKLRTQVTSGNWEVSEYYGFDDKTKKVFYQSVENGSTNRDVYSIGINGKGKRKLTSRKGWNEAIFSPNFKYFINSFSSATSAPVYTLNESKKGTEVKKIVSNEALEQRLAEYSLPQKEFFELTTEKGHSLNAWIIKPTNFDAAKKYPLFMYQYSGPGSQEVMNKWNNYNDYWFKMLAQKGYVVACVDGRGTGFKGAEFKKCTYKELGNKEVEDQIDAAKALANYDYIDGSRIGIFGWSYGGYMASNCIFRGADVFKTAIAVAPVTNWRFYDSVYTERYMQTPQENANGYDDWAPLTHVDKLKGSFLLIHGTGDDNVHVQNTMKMIEALVQANKQFDWAIYPDKNHGIYGGKTRLQLYTKMTNFIQNNL